MKQRGLQRDFGWMQVSEPDGSADGLLLGEEGRALSEKRTTQFRNTQPRCKITRAVCNTHSVLRRVLSNAFFFGRNAFYTYVDAASHPQREKECTIYKRWVDCLKDLYTKRIAELQR